jgi:hypothetical protein
VEGGRPTEEVRRDSAREDDRRAMAQGRKGERTG